MRPPCGGMKNAHIMFVGPDESKENGKLRTVCELINASIIQTGLVEDEYRPLKLLCTLINTVYRQPRARDGRRVPFDFDVILALDAFKHNSITRPPADPTIAPPSSSTGIIPSVPRPVPINQSEDQPRAWLRTSTGIE